MFIRDKAVSDAVYDLLLEIFLKPNDKSDVYSLAAERKAINLLQEAWKELEKYKTEEETHQQKSTPHV